ncbi:MAG: dTMP kinase [Clostridia bacterium]|nr:dTMP kinase [Clostridia bacterium]
MEEKNTNRGLFIVFEGTDGCGKTTQTELLRRRIAETTCRPCVYEQEPNSRNLTGAIIRAALYGSAKISPEAMAYMHVADRLEHIDYVLPLLRSGTNIVCDRYYVSNMAYNATEKLPMEKIFELNVPCRDALRPDAIIFLDIDPEVSAARRSADRTSKEIYDADETQRRVRENYHRVLDYLEAQGDNVIRINAARTVDEVAAEIWENVAPLL